MTSAQVSRPRTDSSSQQPLLYAALAFAGGILLAAQLWHPPTLWLAATVVFLFAGGFFLRRQKFLAQLCGLLAIATLGVLTAQLQTLPVPSNSAITQFTDNAPVVVTGHVIRDGNFRENQRQVVDVESEQIEVNGKVLPTRAGIRLSVYQSPSAEEQESDETEPAASARQLTPLLFGQRIKVTTKLRLPRNFGNPGAFDYRGYLAGQGITALGWARAEAVEGLAGFSGGLPGLWRSRIRRSLQEKIRSLWQPQDAAVVSAMLIGDRTRIDRETTLNYQRSGTYHVLVVSGLTVGILAFPLLWLLRAARVPEVFSTLITLAAMAAYAYVSDGGAPAVRSALMLALYLVTRLLYRGRAPLNAIGTAALAMLILDPQALFDASFQLTFMSILAIAGVAVPILERTSLPYSRALRHLDSRDYDLTLAPRLAQFRLDLRLIAEKLGRFVGQHVATLIEVLAVRAALYAYDVVVVSAIIQLALALPMAVYFHRAVALGLPANVLVVPVQTLLVPPAALALAISYLSTTLAKLPTVIATLALHWTNAVVEWTAHAQAWGLPLGNLRIATPGVALSLFALVTFAGAMLMVRRSRWLAAAGILGLALATSLISVVGPAPSLRPATLEITAIDVGQGDSILVVTPEGKSLLIDAGGALGANSDFDYGEQVVSSYLWARGFARLDAVALTHAHADHIGGLRSVMQNFRPHELWLGANPETEAMRAILAEARQSKVRVLHKSRGDRFHFGGVEFEVLAPPPDWTVTQRPRNNDSLVLNVTYGSTSALLEGDAERQVERALVDGHAPVADVLKIAHHGSATSTTPELLRAVHPKYAVISVGFHSPFGHPRPEVLQRLQQAQVQTFRTDLMGGVTFYLDGKQVTHTTFAEEFR